MLGILEDVKLMRLLVIEDEKNFIEFSFLWEACVYFCNCGVVSRWGEVIVGRVYAENLY